MKDYNPNTSKQNISKQNSSKPKTFYERVYEIVGKIPCGKVVSYGQIASMIGAPRAARQVGWAMSRCPNDYPWQRVVMADGSITGGVFREIRKELLIEEGVPFLNEYRVDIDSCRWDPKAL